MARTEVVLVLALSLGASALYAILSLLQDLSRPAPLSEQAAVINGSVVANHWLDLAYQLVGISLGLVPVWLTMHFLRRSGEGPCAIGLDTSRWPREAAIGVVLALGVGGAGLVLYLGAYHLGLSAKVVPTTLPPVWWRIPVLLLSAGQNAVLEEVVVCGYLLHRLDQLGWRSNRAVLASAILRASYHLYQGAGGFIGNLAMGLLFGSIFERRGRLGRLVVAHGLIDAGAFVGYVMLHGRVSWLP